MEPNQFWSLLARKLAGAATLRDLYELEKLVFECPELRFWQRLVRELWNNREDIEKEPGGEEKFLQLLKEAYRQQFLRLKTKAQKKKNRCCIFSN
jgi:transmembrane sensor